MGIINKFVQNKRMGYKGIILLCAMVFTLNSCKKELVQVNHFRALPFVPLTKTIVEKTFVNFTVTNFTPADTIYWQYSPNGELKGALQGSTEILRLQYSQPYTGSNPGSVYQMVWAISGNDSVQITIENSLPIFVEFYHTGTAQKLEKEYHFTYNTQGMLSRFEEKIGGAEATFMDVYQNANGVDSVVISLISSGITVKSTQFVDFSYQYDVSNIAFIPFILPFPQSKGNASNLPAGTSFSNNILDAYIWSLSSGSGNKKLLNGYSQLGQQGFADRNAVKPHIMFTNNSITCSIGSAEITNIYQ